MRMDTLTLMRRSKSRSKKKVYNNKCLYQKEERSEINNLRLHFKKPRPRSSRKKEIIKVWVEINEIETRETMEEISKTVTWVLEKISQIDKTLAKLTMIKREKLK